MTQPHTEVLALPDKVTHANTPWRRVRRLLGSDVLVVNDLGEEVRLIFTFAQHSDGRRGEPAIIIRSSGEPANADRPLPLTIDKTGA